MIRYISVFLLLSISAFASNISNHELVYTWIGLSILLMSVIGYYIVANEESFSIDKSVPALFTGVFSFMLIAFYYYLNDIDITLVETETENVILEIANIFFFLFVAMTYIESLVFMGVFDKLKYSLISKGYSYKKLFWITGAWAFFISPIADNLTTALILSTVLVTIEKQRKEFLVPAAINIVVAANAGGAWSPFGDITTIMVWTSGKGEFFDFLTLFPASIIGYLITAFLLSLLVPNASPGKIEELKEPELKKGAQTIILLGIFTVFSAIIAEHYLDFPAMWGMMFGLALLKMYAYKLKRKHGEGHFDIFETMSKIENNTLMFFFGMLSVVGALYFIGWLSFITIAYESNNLGIFYSNILVGIASALVDNIPVMSAILKENPDMLVSDWLLATLTAGIGGSLLSFGSAAGIAMMGKLKGIYTFRAHLKYSWIVLIGYFVSIGVWYLQFKVIE